MSGTRTHIDVSGAIAQGPPLSRGGEDGEQQIPRRRLGDPWEVNRNHEGRKMQQSAPPPNAPDIPDGTYTGSCDGCALIDQQARSSARQHCV
jgi:hypothetical protein